MASLLRLRPRSVSNLGYFLVNGDSLRIRICRRRGKLLHCTLTYTYQEILTSVYGYTPNYHKELKGLLTGHLVHLMPLCLNYLTHGMPCSCHRMDKARAIKWLVAWCRISELTTLLITIDARQPRPRISVPPDSARSRVALKPLTLLLLPPEPKENRAENRDDAEQTKDGSEKRRNVTRHPTIFSKDQGSGIRWYIREAGDRRKWPMRGYRFRVFYIE